MRVSPSVVDQLQGSTDALNGRVAVCVTGMIRGFPVAFLNWKLGSLLRLLKVGGLGIDMFFVTPNTSSLRAWGPFIESLRPIRVVAYKPSAVFHSKAGEESWSVREVDGQLHFNLARYPSFVPKYSHSGKHGSVLIQQWQLGVCQRMIIEHEQATGIQYRRAARFRTDSVFSGLARAMRSAVPEGVGFPRLEAANAPFYPARKPDEASYLTCLRNRTRTQSVHEERDKRHQHTHCVEALGKERDALVEACEKYLAHVESKRLPWLAGSETWLVGSRDVVLNVSFRGLQTLETLRSRHGARLNFEEASGIYRIINKEAFESFRLQSGGPCAVAMHDTDFLRAAGPPVRRFFYQFSEDAQALGPCLRGASLEDCLLRAVEGRWAVPFTTVGACLGLDYDVALGWNASCSPAEMSADLARAHYRAFGAQLVGDLFNWAKWRMPTRHVNPATWYHAFASNANSSASKLPAWRQPVNELVHKDPF